MFVPEQMVTFRRWVFICAVEFALGVVFGIVLALGVTNG